METDISLKSVQTSQHSAESAIHYYAHRPKTHLRRLHHRLWRATFTQKHCLPEDSLPATGSLLPNLHAGGSAYPGVRILDSCLGNRMLKPVILCLKIILLSASVSLAIQGPTHLPAQPQPVLPVVPAYPPIAQAACVQGRVAVVVDVDPTGNVTATDVLYGHPLLWQTAVKVARDWKFNAVKEESSQRRELLRFTFRVLPFEAPQKELAPFWSSRTDVEIRTYPIEPSCDDCSEKRRRQLRRGGCPK